MRSSTWEEYRLLARRLTRPFAQEARLNRAYMGGVERGQRNVGAVNLYKIAGALGMSLAELFAEVESTEPRDDT
jgi:transcriptional regulator with XRE-family HTH domain